MIVDIYDIKRNRLHFFCAMNERVVVKIQICELIDNRKILSTIASFESSFNWHIDITYFSSIAKFRNTFFISFFFISFFFISFFFVSKFRFFFCSNISFHFVLIVNMIYMRRCQWSLCFYIISKNNFLFKHIVQYKHRFLQTIKI